MKLAKIGDLGIAKIIELRKRGNSLRDIRDFIKDNYSVSTSHENLRQFFAKHGLDSSDLHPEFVEKIFKEIDQINKYEKKLRSLSKKLEEKGKLSGCALIIQKAASLAEKKARLFSMIAPKEETKVEETDAVSLAQKFWKFIEAREKSGEIRILKRKKTPDIIMEEKDE